MFEAVDFANSVNFTGKHALQYLQLCEKYFKWNQAEHILEIGCADGRITKNVLYPFVEKYLGHLEATDINNEAIDVANSNNCNNKLRFSVMDIEKQQLKDKDKYDHIFSFYVLHLIPNNIWPKTLFNMTKPGGQIFASLYLSPNLFTKVMKSHMTENNKPWAKYYKDYKDEFHSYYGSNPCETVSEYLINEGFTVDMIHLTTAQGIFDSKEAILRAFMSVNSFMRLLPVDMRCEYTKYYGEKLMEEVKLWDDTGAVYQDMNIIIFVASKPKV